MPSNKRTAGAGTSASERKSRAQTKDEHDADHPACQHCGAPIEAALRGRPRVFCSDACRRKAFRERVDEPQVTISRSVVDELGRLLLVTSDARVRAIGRALVAHDYRTARRILSKARRG